MVGIYLCWTRRISGSESEGYLCSLLLLLWLVPDVDKWYRTLGSGEGCLPTSSSVCTLSHSGAHCSVQCSSGWELVAPPPPPHLPACHTDNTCTVTPALHSSNCIASNHHSHRQEQEMQRETTSAARTLHCSWNALSSPASHRRLFALSLPIVFFAVHFAAGATFFAALPLLIDAFSLYKSYFLYFYFFLGRIWSSFVRSVRLDQLKIVPQFIQHNKGSTEKKSVFFRNKS